MNTNTNINREDNMKVVNIVVLNDNDVNARIMNESKRMESNDMYNDSGNAIIDSMDQQISMINDPRTDILHGVKWNHKKDNEPHMEIEGTIVKHTLTRHDNMDIIGKQDMKKEFINAAIFRKMVV